MLTSPTIRVSAHRVWTMYELVSCVVVWYEVPRGVTRSGVEGSFSCYPICQCYLCRFSWARCYYWYSNGPIL